MSAQQDFERAWLAKFSGCLNAVAGKDIRDRVMAGSEGLSQHSSRQEVIAWSKAAMERMDALVDEESRQVIMARCACRYPKSALQAVREAYVKTHDTDLAHHMLQEQFESLLRDTLALSDELVEEIVSRGWGSAGVKQGNTVIATKIPKTGYLVEYLQETDPDRKRQLYCHCPRIRDVLKHSETLSPTYCYCGAGFYRGIWEDILHKPVQVEVLESVLKGDQVCKIAVYLPA